MIVVDSDSGSRRQRTRDSTVRVEITEAAHGQRALLGARAVIGPGTQVERKGCESEVYGRELWDQGWTRDLGWEYGGPFGQNYTGIQKRAWSHRLQH